ncbi:hypothetical protein F5884DRAFT_855091 [Xylogone sp. PMI_703]|nr:hypothetical protein F5884DRAFT_855091 [Xylogone sp. PMI_703]
MDEQNFRLKRFLEEPHRPLIGRLERGVDTSAESSNSVFTPRYPPQRANSGSDQSTVSRGSSLPSAQSSATSVDNLASEILILQAADPELHEQPNLEQIIAEGTMSAIGHNYELPCPASDYIGCGLRFGANDVEHWIQHSVTHFHSYGPPPKSICSFCDNMNDRFDSAIDGTPQENWRNRMLHIRAHYALGELHENSRPDFFVLDYMMRIGAITLDDYQHAIKYSERPYVDGLVDPDFESPLQKQVKRKQELRERVMHNLDKEKRQRRRREQRH